MDSLNVLNSNEKKNDYAIGTKEFVKGFSKLTKKEKLSLVVERFLADDQDAKELIASFWHPNSDIQKNFDEFSENTITNFPIPFGIIPNILINDRVYFAPMAIEESSVIAAASKSAKYWFSRGGFKAEVIETKKVGQVHFSWDGDFFLLKECFESHYEQLIDKLAPYLASMEKRGGGLVGVELISKTELEPDLYQLMAKFETCDAMGANFINTVLENLGHEFQLLVERELAEKGIIQIIMAILSNYTPECLVRCRVSCPIEDLEDSSIGLSAIEFAEKFKKALTIAKIDPYRATTHNKGIFNGIDGVVIATGNDFRAVEACGHAYAARDGQYRSLTNCWLDNGQFNFEIEIPLSLGTVGGLTSLHPMANLALKILGSPDAKELMMVTAAVGLAQNFGAIRSLVTTGIQQGHMKMHLMNILNHLGSTDDERKDAIDYFKDKVISFQSVKDFLKEVRSYQ